MTNVAAKAQRLLLCLGLLVSASSAAASAASGDAALRVALPISHVRASPAATTLFAWPDWARTARIAGAHFVPNDSDAAIDTRLAALAAQHVSVVIADSPWGQAYATWADDSAFNAARDVVARVVKIAHARGLKVVLYQTGLELVSPAVRNPSPEHPDWPQRSLAGDPLLYDDITSTDAHWLQLGEWDLWASPCDSGSRSFRQLALTRVASMAGAGIDGLWVDQVYLPTDVGDHADLWPSGDACSTVAFQAATGLDAPTVENWDDPAWRRWIVWRHAQVLDFLLAVKDQARAVNPNLAFFIENASADTSRATQNANDPAEARPYPDLSTGHEVETIGDRIDEGQTGMLNASLDQWLSLRAMIAFARAADRGKPSWILTYGYLPRDSAQLAGMVLAEGANFYETKGPDMNTSVGADARASIFGWMAEHPGWLFGGQSLADVAVLYSPRTRDLLDSGSGSPYDVEDSVHFAAYRSTTKLLHRAHIPFRVVLDTDTDSFSRFKVLIVPQAQLMSEATTAALRAFGGQVIVIGDETGEYDEWFDARPLNALAGMPALRLDTIDNSIVANADTGLFTTTAPAEVQFGLWQRGNGYAAVVVNTAASPAPAFNVTLRLALAERVSQVELTAPSRSGTALSFDARNDTIQFVVPAGIDSIAAVFIGLWHTPFVPLILK